MNRSFALYISSAFATLGLIMFFTGSSFPSERVQMYWLIGTGGFCFLTGSAARAVAAYNEPFWVGLLFGLLAAFLSILLLVLNSAEPIQFPLRPMLLSMVVVALIAIGSYNWRRYTHPPGQ